MLPSRYVVAKKPLFHRCLKEICTSAPNKVRHAAAFSVWVKRKDPFTFAPLLLSSCKQGAQRTSVRAAAPMSGLRPFLSCQHPPIVARFKGRFLLHCKKSPRTQGSESHSFRDMGSDSTFMPLKNRASGKLKRLHHPTIVPFDIVHH